MTNTDILEVKALLKQQKSIVIVAHKNPDGDAVGSSLGLFHYLKLKGHQVNVILPNDYPDFLKWIPGEEHIIKYESDNALSKKLIDEAELIFTLDFNALHRTGDMELILLESKAIKILIDHHQQPESYPKYTYSDVNICATCQMIYHFIDMMEDLELINSDIATALYTGIMTDTGGSFRFKTTTSTTHRVIADLIDKGAKGEDIHSNVYDTNSYNRLQLLGRSLNNLKVIPKLSTAYISLSQQELNQFNFKKGDTEGVVNYALSLKGVKFAAIFIEHKQEGIIKISFRSKGNFDTNTLARTHFNGGGHLNASGGKSTLGLKDTIAKFISILPQYKKDLNS